MKTRRGFTAQILWRSAIGISTIASATFTNGVIAQAPDSTSEIVGVESGDPTPVVTPGDRTEANQPTSVAGAEAAIPPASDNESESVSRPGSASAEESSSSRFGKVESPSPFEADEEAAFAKDHESRLLPPDPREKSKLNGSGSRSAAEDSDSGTISDEQGKGFLDSPNWFLRTIGGLGAILTILFLLRPLLKRLAGPLGSARAPSGVIEALARYPFGKGQFLVLLKLDTRILLICQTAQGSNVITEITGPDEVASILRRVHDEKGESFNRKLEAILHDSGTGTDFSRSGPTSQESVRIDSEEQAVTSSNLIDLTATTGSARNGRRSWFSMNRGSVKRHGNARSAATVDVK